MTSDKTVAIGFLTEANVKMLGTSLKRVIPITDDDQFAAILKALDEAEAARRERR